MTFAQRIRCFMLLFVMLVMITVFVVCKQSPPSATASAEDAFDSKRLALRKNLALSIGDQSAGENQQFVPIPDNAVPIQWERVQDRRGGVAATRTTLPPGPQQAPQGRELPHPAGRLRRNALPQPPVETPKLRQHRIVDGETLRDISARYLGSPDRFMELFYANRAVLPHPDVLPLGAKIRIPPRQVVPRQPLPQYTPLPTAHNHPAPSRTLSPNRVAPQTDGFRSSPMAENPWRSRADES